MLCCSSVNRLLHSELPAFGIWDRVSDHHTDCVLADEDHNLVHVADRGHAHARRLDRDLVLLRMSDRHFLVPVFGKGRILLHLTDTCFALPPVPDESLVPAPVSGWCLFLAPVALKRLVLLPVADRGVALRSVIDAVLLPVHGSGRHFLFGLLLVGVLVGCSWLRDALSQPLWLIRPLPYPLLFVGSRSRFRPWRLIRVSFRLKALKRRLLGAPLRRVGSVRLGPAGGESGPQVLPEASLLPFPQDSLGRRVSGGARPRSGPGGGRVRAGPEAPTCPSAAVGSARRAATAAASGAERRRGKAAAVAWDARRGGAGGGGPAAGFLGGTAAPFLPGLVDGVAARLQTGPLEGGGGGGTAAQRG